MAPKLVYIIRHCDKTDDKDDDGFSSILWASAQIQVNAIEFLLSKGANLHDITNKKKGRIGLEGPLGFEVLQELLETPLFSL